MIFLSKLFLCMEQFHLADIIGSLTPNKFEWIIQRNVKLGGETYVLYSRYSANQH